MAIVRQGKSSSRLPAVICVIITATASIISFKSFHIYNSFVIIPRTHNTSSIIVHNVSTGPIIFYNTSKNEELSTLTDPLPLVVNRSKCTIIVRGNEGQLGNKMFIFAKGCSTKA
jgi:hypothetical protein